MRAKQRLDGWNGSNDIEPGEYSSSRVGSELLKLCGNENESLAAFIFSNDDYDDDLMMMTSVRLEGRLFGELG